MVNQTNYSPQESRKLLFDDVVSDMRNSREFDKNDVKAVKQYFANGNHYSEELIGDVFRCVRNIEQCREEIDLVAIAGLGVAEYADGCIPLRRDDASQRTSS